MQDLRNSCRSLISSMQKNAALYELDNDPDGFMWLENSNPEETVIAMQRADSRVISL